MMKREWLLDWPSIDLGVGNGAHRIGVRAHPFAMKSGQDQSPVVQMRRAIQKQQGSFAHERAQRAVCFAGPKDRRVTLENFSNSQRVAGENEGWNSGYAQREPVAIAARAIIEEPEGIADKIEGCEKTRSRRQLRRLKARERGIGST